MMLGMFGARFLGSESVLPLSKPEAYDYEGYGESQKRTRRSQVCGEWWNLLQGWPDYIGGLDYRQIAQWLS